jgi:hypothetical protein
LDSVGGRWIDAIDQETVDAVIAKHFADLRPATIVRNLITPLTAVLNWAERRGWCKALVFERPKGSRTKRKWWSSENEIDGLVAAATAHFLSLLLFLLLAGCRISVALRLEWEDVDLNARWLVFRNTKRRRADEDVGEDRCRFIVNSSLYSPICHASASVACSGSIRVRLAVACPIVTALARVAAARSRRHGSARADASEWLICMCMTCATPLQPGC